MRDNPESAILFSERL